MTDVTRILNAIEEGDARAADRLLPLVYEELRTLAARKLSHESPGQTLQATALVHEAYLRLVGAAGRNWDSRGHFFAAAAEAMRRILVDNARRKKALRRGGVHRRVDLKEAALASLSLTEAPGATIGRYRLVERIGEGGMAVVYMAEQQEPVHRNVALKVIKLGMDTKQVIARFEAERQALAMMDHPSIARVLDAGATETGRPYFVMELVRGASITDYCDANSLSTNERLKLFVEVCDAIQHAHQKGIIHRDIKPSNVMVALHDGRPVPKVIDFGIAKATNQRLNEKTVFTRYAQMIGTPAYMSPEQAELIVLPGTYAGQGNRDISFLGRAITVRSLDPNDSAIVSATVIDCEATQAAQHQGFVFKTGESAQSVLAGLTITNAYSSYGGGINCTANSSPTISKCVLRGNRASQRGGGMYNASGGPLITNCIFSGNTAPNGGALYNLSNAKLVNCTFRGNSTTTGGGVHNQGGTLTLANYILWDNTPAEVRVGAGTASVTYSDIKGGFAGTGNIMADPLFADPANGDYHLKSPAGRWDAGSQSWVLDGITSPCIDAGDPSSPVGYEPQPNGGRINMGAYGGTPEASKSP